MRSAFVVVFSLGSLSLLPAQERILRLTGQQSGDSFSLGIAGCGDVDGDGFADVAVGAYQAGSGTAPAGEVMIHSGVSGNVLHRHQGVTSDERFGWSVAGIGDVNADGRDDYAVGAWRHDGGNTDSGRVLVYSGRDGSVLYDHVGTATRTFLGFAVAGVGDVDGDGCPDYAASEHDHLSFGRADLVRVYSGRDGSPIYERAGDRPGQTLGTCIAGLGDLDGDGHSDWLAGGAFDDLAATNAGMARVFSGRDGSELYEFSGARANDRFGLQCSGGGDIDGDGIPDFLIGANGSDSAGNDAGSVAVYSGADGSLITRQEGRRAGDAMVASAIVGDVNGDGHAEFALGSPSARTGGVTTGNVLLMDGRSLIPLYTFTGAAGGDNLGRLLSAAGDLDGDGRGDLLVAAPGAGSPGFRPGETYGFASNPLYLQARNPNPAPGTQLRLDIRGGIPGQLAAVFRLGPTGQPVGFPVGVAALNVNGAWRLSVPVLPVASGLSAQLRAFSIGTSGRLVQSGVETVAVP